MKFGANNFKADILQAVGTETIEAVRIDTLIEGYFFDDKEDPRDTGVKELLGKVLTWEQAAPLLDYEFDAGFGGMDCHDITIWTAENVYYIHEYDGSTRIKYVERHPVEIAQ